ncbi:dynein assembly factor 1, axonemal homolog [Apis dorsata]|uniref:dynein assembly factor 1, axonemal homolog n=1 Tax=Apis dorsata TaxID=7462 RepID=UPI001293F4D9|nr:dynein assembly factor 1, axonemal homolog [Apis dorsata]
MTEEFLKKHCKQHKLYQTPHLNDVLYLHYKGFSFIENLEKYTGLKCLWLENNGIREIANLENQSELKCLFLHNNLISKIENLEYLTKLDTLNLSYNTIRRIENLDSLKFLNTLNLSHNYLQSTGDIEHLRLLDSLSVLDISHNRIDTDEVVNILGDMKELRVVSLMGNPILKAIKLYRKTMILKCKNLKYLDDRPVFPRDRACAEAWMRGGPEEEAAERKRWIEAEQKKINDSVLALINKRKQCKPVETSEKEAEDKKRTKEDEEVAATTVVCTSDELLNLEKKKKLEVSSSSDSSSASSSSGEEEDDGPMQKSRIEKSDGRRPMEEGGKASSPDRGANEILLPWKTQVPARKSVKKLVEVIEEDTKEFVAGDTIREWTTIGKGILEERSIDDPSIDREMGSRTNEITPSCSEEQGKFKSVSVSCNISGANERKKEGNIASNECPPKDILDNYRRRDDPHPLSGQLSSIREDMKEFCAEMDKFVEKNKFVLKDSDKTRKGESSAGEEKDSFKWWDTKERKLKVKEILRQREEAEKRSKNVKRVEIVEVDKEEEKEEEEEEEEEEKEEEASKNVKEAVKDEKKVPSCQGVYDLLNLKKCPQILLKDVKTRARADEDDAMLKCETVKNDNSKDRLSGLYNSLFNEMNYRSGIDKNRSRKSLSSQELLTLEKIDETAEETTRSASCIDIISSDVDNSEIISVKSEPVNVKIMETSTANVTSLNSTDDEISDSESVKTIINNYDKPTREIDQEANASTNDIPGEPGENNCGRDKSDNVKIIEAQSDNDEIQSLEASSEKDAKVSPSSNVEKSTISSKSHKRSRDCECQDVASKKFHLIEEIDGEQNPTSSEKTVDGISEKCKRHFIKEAREFVKKESPLIDQCIEDLISKKSKGNWDLKNNQEDFLTCTALNITSDIFSNKTSENSDKRIGSNEQSRAMETKKLFNVQNSEDDREVVKSDSSIDKQVDIKSIDNLLKQSTIAQKQSKMCTDLYKQFCKHLEEIDSKRKLLIEPDFMKKNKSDQEEKKRDVLSPRETKQSKEEQTKSLIEVISEDATTNVEELEVEKLVFDSDPVMDAELKDKILKNINTPKSEEEREEGKKSADKLMKISREAMAKGKSLLDPSFPTCGQKNYFKDSRRFFMNLLEDDFSSEKDEDPAKNNIHEEYESESIMFRENSEALIEEMEKLSSKMIEDDGIQGNKVIDIEKENVAIISESSVIKIEEIEKLSPTEGNSIQDGKILDMEKENVNRVRKSLEMQIVQGN